MSEWVWRGCRKLWIVAVLAACFTSGSCQSEQEREAQRRREERDRNSAAFKAGEAAHEVARKAEAAAAAAGRKLDEDARQASEGWKAQAKKDREQQKEQRH
jgi:hypothetical protein